VYDSDFDETEDKTKKAYIVKDLLTLLLFVFCIEKDFCFFFFNNSDRDRRVSRPAFQQVLGLLEMEKNVSNFVSCEGIV
jgi:hypothetical protein